jgi:hypothetical protein
MPQTNQPALNRPVKKPIQPRTTRQFQVFAHPLPLLPIKQHMTREFFPSHIHPWALLMFAFIGPRTQCFSEF